MFLQVESFEACQKNSDKLVVTSTELHPVPVHTTWYHVAIDFIGPISPVSLSGNRSVYLLIFFIHSLLEIYVLPLSISYNSYQ